MSMKEDRQHSRFFSIICAQKVNEMPMTYFRRFRMSVRLLHLTYLQFGSFGILKEGSNFIASWIGGQE